MTHRKPVIALISATPVAIPPAQAAITAAFGDVDVWNILDDRLMVEAESRGGLTPELAARMETLIGFAVSQGADAALLTCSLYGSVADQYVGPIPILAPDSAVFDDVINSPYRRVLVVASFDEALHDSTTRLREAAAARGRAVEVSGVAVPAAMASAKSGDPAPLVDDLTAAIQPLVETIDAVLLAQYSLAPARAGLEELLGLPVFSGPLSAARKLRTQTAEEPTHGILGAIADDYTGAIDVADALRSAGLRTLLFFGTEGHPDQLPQHDAIVVALKTRSVPATEAVETSLAALDYLRSHGADQVYFKYCSTFDSTPDGNIGPVLAALSEKLNAGAVVTTPSSPMHARTVYNGHLYVGDLLLEQSHMAHHPLNPMTDSLLPRLLTAQTGQEVHTLSLATIRAGIGAIGSDLERHSGSRPSFVIADGVTQDDLDTLAATQVDSALVAGAAGFALALGRARVRHRGRTESSSDDLVRGHLRSAVLAGSCSASTLEQIEQMQRHGFPSHQLVASADMTVEALVGEALGWFDALPTGSVPLFYSSVGPEELRRIRRDFDGPRASGIFEQSLAEIAAGLRDRGIERFVVAGGETSGSVTSGLGVTGGIMGGQVDEGVAWLYSAQQPGLALLLKSGNFGKPDLFLRATDPQRDWGEHRDR